MTNEEYSGPRCILCGSKEHLLEVEIRLLLRDKRVGYAFFVICLDCREREESKLRAKVMRTYLGDRDDDVAKEISGLKLSLADFIEKVSEKVRGRR